jgi:hypothetical protein
MIAVEFTLEVEFRESAATILRTLPWQRVTIGCESSVPNGLRNGTASLLGADSKLECYSNAGGRRVPLSLLAVSPIGAHQGRLSLSKIGFPYALLIPPRPCASTRTEGGARRPPPPATFRGARPKRNNARSTRHLLLAPLRVSGSPRRRPGLRHYLQQRLGPD